MPVLGGGHQLPFCSDGLVRRPVLARVASDEAGLQLLRGPDHPSVPVSLLSALRTCSPQRQNGLPQRYFPAHRLGLVEELSRAVGGG